MLWNANVYWSKPAQLVARRDLPSHVVSRLPQAIYRNTPRTQSFWDVEGNRYIDFVGGIGVLNTATVTQGDRRGKGARDQYTHTSFQVVPYGPL